MSSTVFSKVFSGSTDSADKRGFVQVAVPLSTDISPLQAYGALRAQDSSGYAYLLESVEKEKRHARFSFVGATPLAVITIKNRILTIEFLNKTPLFESITGRVSGVCEKLSLSEGVLRAHIAQGYDVFDALRASILITEPVHSTLEFPRQVFTGGTIGFVAYDSVYDSHLDMKPFDSSIPDAQFVLTTQTLLFDHLSEKTYLVCTEHLTPELDQEALEDTLRQRAGRIEELLSSASGPEHSSLTTPLQDGDSQDTEGRTISCTADKTRFEAMVRCAKQHIIDGDILQVVLSRRYELETHKTAYELYEQLRGVNPSPYMYLFEFKDTAIIGASPETLLSVKNRKVTTNPIAGTCPRGATPEEDETLAQRMLLDEKERAEHVMLVDLGRNDVRAVCKPGSVVVEDYMSVLKYSHVQHIESTVVGELREECDAFDATREIFPAGTLSGAPKIRAMEIIHDLEDTSRGVYGGGVGYYCFNGDADFAIVIRTMIKQGNRLYIQAGAGIVADSDPEYEYNETERKMAAMMKVVRGEEKR